MNVFGGLNKLENLKLYNSPNVANRIKSVAKIKGKVLKDILQNCNLGSNTFSHMLHGKSIAYDSLANIADYLDCSVDFLLGRSTNANSHKTFIGDKETSDEERLVKAYRQLTDEGQRAILTTAELYASSEQYQKYTDISKEA